MLLFIVNFIIIIYFFWDCFFNNAFCRNVIFYIYYCRTNIFFKIYFTFEKYLYKMYPPTFVLGSFPTLNYILEYYLCTVIYHYKPNIFLSIYSTQHGLFKIMIAFIRTLNTNLRGKNRLFVHTSRRKTFSYSLL